MIPASPSTYVESVNEIFPGVPLADSYRWLEDQDSARTRRWLEEESNYTRAYFGCIANRPAILARVREMLCPEVTEAPLIIGTRYFFRKRNAATEQACIYVRDEAQAKDILLVDPASFSTGNFTSVNILSISRNGKMMALGVKQGGEDTQTVKILAVDERRILDDTLPHGFCRGVAFSLDEASIYYSHTALSSDRPNYRAIYKHVLGTQLRDDREVFFAAEDPSAKLSLRASPNGQYLLFVVARSQPSRSKTIYLQETDSRLAPRLIAQRTNEVLWATLAGARIILLTQCEAPNLRVVEVTIEHPVPEHWREIIPESERVIRQVVTSNTKLFVTYDSAISTVTKVFDFDGAMQGEIDYPEHGTARVVTCPQNGAEVFYSFTSFLHPPTIIRYNCSSKHQSVWATRNVPFDSSSIEVRRTSYVSQDGSRIPISLLSKRVTRSGPRPVVLTAYGGFGNSCTPQFSAFGTFVVESGGIFAVANVRGGGEIGEAWHEAGKGPNRQNAINDLICAAEWLVKERYTTIRKMGVIGASGGGLLVAAAMIQRPDLFRAVMCVGPLLDMLRYHRFGPAHFWIEEFGSAERASDFSYLRQYSPYHNVKDGTAYPAVLLISGDADKRCDGMHSRKMTARLQAATSSPYPVILDYKPMRGHSPVLPLNERIDALTDRLSFMCQELGIEVEIERKKDRS